jgi:hypothetical protein
MRAPADRVVTIPEDKMETAPIQRQFIQSFSFFRPRCDVSEGGSQSSTRGETNEWIGKLAVV